jgi:hypothetical protein
MSADANMVASKPYGGLITIRAARSSFPDGAEICVSTSDTRSAPPARTSPMKASAAACDLTGYQTRRMPVANLRNTALTVCARAWNSSTASNGGSIRISPRREGGGSNFAARA